MKQIYFTALMFLGASSAFAEVSDDSTLAKIFHSMPVGEEVGQCTADYPTSICSFIETRKNDDTKCTRNRTVHYRCDAANCETITYQCESL